MLSQEDIFPPEDRQAEKPAPAAPIEAIQEKPTLAGPIKVKPIKMSEEERELRKKAKEWHITPGRAQRWLKIISYQKEIYMTQEEMAEHESVSHRVLADDIRLMKKKGLYPSKNTSPKAS